MEVQNNMRDVVVIGGGIVGLATAYRLLQQKPDACVRILEKESELSSHQSGRNSGVLHSGVYYAPGSLKAKNCRAGKEAMIKFCQEEGIDYDICGKVVVATSADEVPALQDIYARGQANGVKCSMIGPDELRELEPHVAGVQAIHVPETGVVDYRKVSERLALRIREMGGTILTDAEVTAMEEADDGTMVHTVRGSFRGDVVINCAGLHSDRVASMSGRDASVQIVPFRGEYYVLKPEAQSLCRSLIYPVPNPNFPFLGVHFTRTIDGRVECGPNAVLAFAREGYTMSSLNLRDLSQTLGYSGFRRLAARYWRVGIREMWRSVSKQAFVRALQRLVPDIRAEHLVAAPAGVRAQAVTPDGQLVDDFKIETVGDVVNVCNAPSPAATSSLNIGQLLAERVIERVPVL
jgi:L-2-hydroxyglutarate oxidase